MSSRTPSDVIKHVNVISPQTAGISGVVTVADIDTTGWHWATIVLNVGVSASTSTGNLTLRQATAAGGAYSSITDDGVNNGVNAQSAIITHAAGLDNLSLYGEIDLEQFENFLEFKFTNGGGGTTLFSVDLILHGPKDTKSLISDDAASIKNTQQYQLLQKLKPAF